MHHRKSVLFKDLTNVLIRKLILQLLVIDRDHYKSYHVFIPIQYSNSVPTVEQKYLDIKLEAFCSSTFIIKLVS